MFTPQVKSKLFDLLSVFAVFFTPILFFIEGHDQFELPKLLFLALLTVFFLLFELQDPAPPGWTPLSIALLALLACQTLSSLPATSLSWRTSLLGEYENFAGLTTLWTFLVWFAFLSRILNEARIQKWLYFNSLAAVLSSLYAIGQHFGFDFIQWNPESVNATREFAAMGNPNFLSAYLAMSLPLFWAVSLAQKDGPASPKPWPGPLYWFLAVLGAFLLILGTPQGIDLVHFPPSDGLRLFARSLGLFYLSAALIRFNPFHSLEGSFVGSIILTLGLFSTGSRGGFLGAFLGALVWLYLALRQKEWREFIVEEISKRWKNHPIVMVVSAFAFSILLTAFGISFLSRFFLSTAHLSESFAISRMHIWRPGIEIVKTHPFLGIGLDTFKIAFPFYSGVEFNLIDGMFTSSRMAHDQPLQMAATTGLLGLAAYLGVIAAFGVMWWKCYRSANPTSRWVLAAILASAVAYHVQNLFSFDVATIDLLWFFCLACVQFHYRKRIQEEVAPSPSVFILWKGLALLLALAILVFPMERLGADVAFSHGSAASDLLKRSNSGQDPKALGYYSDYEIYHMRKATDLFPWDVKYRLYLGLAYEHRIPLDSLRSREWALKALGSYQQAIEMSPANAYYYNDEGRIYEDLAKVDPSYSSLSEAAYGNSVHWAPASPFFLINWGLSLKKNGKVSEGEEQLKKAFSYSSDFTAKTLGQMAQGAYQSGDKRTAFELADLAVQGDTACAEAYYYRGYLYFREKELKKALADFERVKDLNPSPEKNPTIQLLDQFIEESKR